MGLPRGAVNNCLLHAALFFKETITYKIFLSFRLFGFLRNITAKKMKKTMEIGTFLATGFEMRCIRLCDLSLMMGVKVLGYLQLLILKLVTPRGGLCKVAQIVDFRKALGFESFWWVLFENSNVSAQSFRKSKRDCQTCKVSSRAGCHIDCCSAGSKTSSWPRCTRALSSGSTAVTRVIAQRCSSC